MKIQGQSHNQLCGISPDLNCLQKICSITNLFGTNIRKFDTKKTYFFAQNAKTVQIIRKN